MPTEVHATAPESRLSHGLKNVAVKGEDASAVLKGEAHSTSCFAVFDGHGGRKASAHGAERLAPRLQALGVSATDERIADLFWEADAEIGSEGQTDGSTATVLLVHDSVVDGNSGVECTLAWVGDSQACVFDLSAASGAADGPVVVGETSCHNGASADERNRLEQTWQLSREVREEAQATGDRFGGLQPSVDAIKSIANRLQIALSEADAALIARAVERGSLIDAMKPGDADANMHHGPTSVLAPRLAGGKLFLHKTLPDVRLVKEITLSPIVHSTSTAVTRAIGDWDASRAIVPQPEILRVRCRAERCLRVVLATDGLWDFVSTAEARKILCRCASSQACADRLAAKAVARSKSRLNLLKDDVTVVVVTINPSGLPLPLSAANEGRGCSAGLCAIS